MSKSNLNNIKVVKKMIRANEIHVKYTAVLSHCDERLHTLLQHLIGQ